MWSQPSHWTHSTLNSEHKNPHMTLMRFKPTIFRPPFHSANDYVTTAGRCRDVGTRAYYASEFGRISSLQSLDRLCRRVDMRDDSAETLSQSFLQQALGTDAGTERKNPQFYGSFIKNKTNKRTKNPQKLRLLLMLLLQLLTIITIYFVSYLSRSCSEQRVCH